MRIKPTKKYLFLSLLLLSLAILPVCSGLSPLSPNDTLADLVYAYNHHNFAIAPDIYKSCLHPNYTFHFRDEDVGIIIGDYEIPETWSRSTDIIATENLFNQVQSITLSIPAVDGLGTPSGESYLVEDVAVDLTVTANPSTVYHAVGTVDIEFQPDENGDWRIYNLWDETDSTTSWGWIKAKYYSIFL